MLEAQQARREGMKTQKFKSSQHSSRLDSLERGYIDNYEVKLLDQRFLSFHLAVIPE